MLHSTAYRAAAYSSETSASFYQTTWRKTAAETNRKPRFILSYLRCEVSCFPLSKQIFVTSLRIFSDRRNVQCVDSKVALKLLYLLPAEVIRCLGGEL